MSKNSTLHSILYHTTRLCQYLSAISVAGIISYFIYILKRNSYPSPWAFIFLLSVASTEIVWLILTTFRAVSRMLGSIVSTIIDLLIALAWLSSTVLVGIRIQYAVNTKCTVEFWMNTYGVFICRLYKGLFASTIIAVFSAFVAILVDVKYRKNRKSRDDIGYRKAKTVDDTWVPGMRGVSDAGTLLYDGSYKSPAADVIPSSRRTSQDNLVTRPETSLESRN
ncbi:hypothetical protein PV10_08676 [Exophiala mesophila]|uniref:MARVEL domain-containing protein n=1 Tax=Exophiala mesophila TaxID=212818 RepID=A0A0D1WJM7_EXOME|nr:uncharacterized protein PV10_08676 [Exophiala mesophila]KIV89065.1 hypothetical protein PV10_08676 [Exophiala mesophila]